jgi:hypothetical protein
MTFSPDYHLTEEQIAYFKRRFPTGVVQYDTAASMRKYDQLTESKDAQSTTHASSDAITGLAFLFDADDRGGV